MTDRIQNLVDAGRLSREPASDDEIAGLWGNAAQAFQDAQVDSISANGRLVRAYDAGRIAAATIVRSRDLRVRAANHHELTLAVAALASGPDLAKAFNEMDGMRRLRADLEYGWQAGASVADVQRALDVVRRILQGGSAELAAVRPSLSARLTGH
jgi:hypothetical protein